MIFKTEAPRVAPDELRALVEDFLTRERPRRLSLTEYYRGEQDVRKGPVAQGRPNNRLVSNYARYISDVHTGYFMGKPPTLSFARKRVQEKMVRALNEASFGRMLYAAARDMSVCGEGYLLTYPGEKGPRIARLDPLETFAVTWGLREDVFAAVRVREKDARRAVGELWLPGEVIPWELEGTEMTYGQSRPTGTDGLAVSWFRNNGEGTGDFESVTTLLDAYNVLLSGAMDDMQSVANAFLALYGAMGTTQQDIDRANRSRVLCMADNGKAEFVVKNLSPDAISLLRDTLVGDMLSITMTPNLQDEAFSGAASGVALEYKLWGIEQARSAKEQGFSGGLYHLIGLFYQIFARLGEEIDCPCAALFHKNLPQDLSRLCTDLQTLGDTVSRRTKLELLPFVKDSEDELRRIEEEKRGE